MTGSKAQEEGGSGVLPAASNPLALPPVSRCKFQAQAPWSPLGLWTGASDGIHHCSWHEARWLVLRSS